MEKLSDRDHLDTRLDVKTEDEDHTGFGFDGAIFSQDGIKEEQEVDSKPALNVPTTSLSPSSRLVTPGSNHSTRIPCIFVNENDDDEEEDDPVIVLDKGAVYLDDVKPIAIPAQSTKPKPKRKKRKFTSKKPIKVAAMYEDEDEEDGKSATVEPVGPIILIRCSVCGAGYATHKLFKQHMLDSHKEKRPYACRQCGKRYSKMVEVIKHETVHTPKRVRLYICQVCNMEFRKQARYAAHLRKKHRLLPDGKPRKGKAKVTNFTSSHKESEQSVPLMQTEESESLKSSSFMKLECS